MEKHSAKALLEKYRQGKYSDEERAVVEAWYAGWNHDQPRLDEDGLEKAVDRVFSRLPGPEPKIKQIGWRHISIAASLFVLLAASVALLMKKHDGAIQTAQNSYQGDVGPGGNKAVLVLANGKKISLTDAKNGELAAQSGIKITKIADGQLVYEVTEVTGSTDHPVYNTIETPRGGQYQVRLPDGTKVWLNAASSLKYPASFKSLKERKVELSGEAYFEVAHDKNIPFRVMTGKQEVEVLGTHFNINGYAEEGVVQTTLLEGSVKVLARSAAYSGHMEILKPGQQSTLGQHEFKVAQADTETIMAWKNGDFIFKNEDFKTAMRKVARWYDVDVIYELTAPVTIQPGGWISRKNNISAVLEMIESTGKVQFKIKGRSVIVGNK